VVQGAGRAYEFGHADEGELGAWLLALEAAARGFLGGGVVRDENCDGGGADFVEAGSDMDVSAQGAATSEANSVGMLRIEARARAEGCESRGSEDGGNHPTAVLLRAAPESGWLASHSSACANQRAQHTHMHERAHLSSPSTFPSRVRTHSSRLLPDSPSPLYLFVSPCYLFLTNSPSPQQYVTSDPFLPFPSPQQNPLPKALPTALLPAYGAGSAAAAGPGLRCALPSRPRRLAWLKMQYHLSSLLESYPAQRPQLLQQQQEQQKQQQQKQQQKQMQQKQQSTFRQTSSPQQSHFQWRRVPHLLLQRLSSLLRLEGWWGSRGGRTRPGSSRFCSSEIGLIELFN
jgi:hypothetical protein